MDEFWICQHCKSLNRAGQGKCYHCKEKFGSKPKNPEGSTHGKGDSKPKPPVILGGGPSQALPGLNPEPPQYLTRPTALPGGLSGPPAHNSYSDQYRLAAEAEGPQAAAGRHHHPSPIGRHIGRWLARRQSVPVTALGYVTAAVLTVLLVLSVLLAITVEPQFMRALQTTSLKAGWNQVNPLQTGTMGLAIAFGAVAILGLILFSLFVGLSTHNAPGLGSVMPMLSPYQAGSSWFGLLRSQLLLAIGLLLPAGLFWFNYPLPGAIALLIALELGHRRVNQPLGWINLPSRHLVDLLNKLATTGASGTIVGRIWAACFKVANVLLMLVLSLPILGVVIVAISAVAEQPGIRSWSSSGLGTIQLICAWVFGLMVALMTVSLALLIPLSVELVERQRTRKTLVRVGRARPWIAHADEPERRLADRTGIYDPYARPEEDEEEPSQASLYSPSTTPSSPPWSDER